MSVIIRSATGPCQQMTTAGNGYPWQDGDALAAADLNAAFAAAYNNVGRNLIHNPLFNIQQRGQGPWTTNGAYTVDRWIAIISGDTASFTIVPGGDLGRSQIGDESYTSAFQNIFTGSAAATSYHSIAQRIESVRRLSGKTVTVSFYAIASTTSKLLGCNLYQSFGTGGSPSPGGWIQPTGERFTITPAWQRFSATFILPTANGKTFGTANDDFTQLSFIYSSGATNNAIFGNVGVQSGQLLIWGVQLEIGSVMTPLEKPEPRYDHANCLRFYRNSGMVLQIGFNAWGAAAVQFLPVYHPVPMRAAPTIVLGAQGGATNIASANVNNNWPDGFWLQAVSAASGGAAVSYSGFSASADL